MIERQADHNLLVEGTQAVLTAHYSRTGFHSAAGGVEHLKSTTDISKQLIETVYPMITRYFHPAGGVSVVPAF